MPKQGDVNRIHLPIAIAIAVTSLITAGVAVLQENASANGASAARNTERYAVLAASDAVAGQARVNYDYNAAFKQWESLNFQALQAELTGDEDRADRLKAQRERYEAMTAVRAHRMLHRAIDAMPRPLSAAARGVLGTIKRGLSPRAQGEPKDVSSARNSRSLESRVG